jgi:hypothetical protein
MNNLSEVMLALDGCYSATDLSLEVSEYYDTYFIYQDDFYVRHIESAYLQAFYFHQVVADDTLDLDSGLPYLYGPFAGLNRIEAHVLVIDFYNEFGLAHPLLRHYDVYFGSCEH